MSGAGVGGVAAEAGPAEGRGVVHATPGVLPDGGSVLVGCAAGSAGAAVAVEGGDGGGLGAAEVSTTDELAPADAATDPFAGAGGFPDEPGASGWGGEPHVPADPLLGVDAAHSAEVVLAAASVDARAGLLSRTGAPGANQLLAEVGTATVAQPLGPVQVEAAALLVGLGDGEEDRAGAAGTIGLSSAPDAPYLLRGLVGSSPVGLSAEPYATWYAAAGWRVGRAEIALDTGRAPITDSLASWGGAANGSWGRASTTWAGAWVAWTGDTSDLGLRARVGQVEALDARTGRRQLDLWAGHRLGSTLRSVRVGLEGSLLAHDEQLDAFRRGASGAFTPLAYTAGAARVDGEWGLGRGARLCGGLRVGAQAVDGEDSAFFGAGTFAAAGVRAGGALRLARRWEAGVTARWDVVGEDWSEQAGVAWLGYVPDDDASDAPAPPPTFGAAVEALSACE